MKNISKSTFFSCNQKGCFDDVSAWWAYMDSSVSYDEPSWSYWFLIGLGITVLSVFVLYIAYLIIRHFYLKRKQRKIDEDEENYINHNISHLPLNIYLNMPK